MFQLASRYPTAEAGSLVRKVGREEHPAVGVE
jgi:hypothetical protein